MSKRALIADDSAYMRAVVKTALTEMGFLISGEVADGAQAVTHYKQWQPDLVILNVVMPKMGGIAALQAIREWDPNARVVMCSAMVQAQTISQAIHAGAIDFLAKPLDIQHLGDVIQRLFSIA